MLLLNLTFITSCLLGMALTGELPPIRPIQPQYKELQCDEIVGKAKLKKSSEFKPFLFTSPRYPNAYPKNSKCEVTFKVPKGKKVYFYFNDVDIYAPDQTKCGRDFLRISDGTSKEDFCGQFNETSHLLGPYNKLTNVKVIFQANKDKKKGRGVSLAIWSKQLTVPLGNFSCGLSDAKSRSAFEDRIIGGRNTSISEHPWNVFMFGYYNKTSLSLYHGGTLISPQWVLTSIGPNDLWTDPAMNDIIVILNITKGGEDSVNWERLSAVDVKTMDNSGFPFFDLALVKLNKSVNIAPACLAGPDYFYKAGKNYLSIGLGIDYDLENIPPGTINFRLREVDLELHSKDFCAQAANQIAPYGTLTEEKLALLDPYPQDYIICAGENGTTTCLFDQGSPLTDEINGYSIAVGITSFWSTNCTGQTFYAKVQTAADWIYEIVNESE